MENICIAFNIIYLSHRFRRLSYSSTALVILIVKLHQSLGQVFHWTEQCCLWKFTTHR